MRRTANKPLRAVGVLVIAAGVVVGASGCGYSHNWNTGAEINRSNGTTLNWQYPTPQTAP